MAWVFHEAVALIRLRRQAVLEGCPFLFPGDVPDQPVGDPKLFWSSIREVAEITDVRIHGLKRTFAWLLASSAASLAMIGPFLGLMQIRKTQAMPN